MAYSELYQKCIPIILKSEGGYSNHSSDYGGETNFGIAKKFYPNEDIKNLTKERAAELFHRDYWIPMKLEGINNNELVLQVFDVGVNSGPKTGVKLLQRLVGTDPDGVIGPKTLQATNNYPGNIVDEFKQKRRLFYAAIVTKDPSQKVFLKGWLNRIENTKF